MNEIHELEKHLRSWVPRRPSPRLEERIFAATPPETRNAHRESHPGIRWLAPATVALLAMFILLNNRPVPQMERVQTTGTLAAVIMSNRNAAAALATTSMQSRNNITADRLEWTNGNGSFPNIYSVSLRDGN